MSGEAVHDRRRTNEVLKKMSEEEEVLVDTVAVTLPPGCCGARHILAFMGFLGFANVYAMRVNLSVAIVAMVNNTAIPHANKTEVDVCPTHSGNSTKPSEDGEFAWDEYEQGLILGSFFWGYVLTNMIGGRLGELIGGKVVFGVGVLVTSILTLVTPVVAHTSTPLLIALRVVEGLGEGVTFPAMNALMAKWVPPLERSKMSSLVYAGSQFGTVVSLPISGLLCQSSFLKGWPAVFYLFGVLGLLWFFAWMFLNGGNALCLPISAAGPDRQSCSYVTKTFTSVSPCIRGNLPSFLKNLLTDRHFRVRVNNVLSPDFVQAEGVPQGCVLSTTLFLLAINDLASVLPPNIWSSLYVDDFAIACAGADCHLIAVSLQHAVDRVSTWATTHGFKFSSTKTHQITFTRRSVISDHPLYLYGSRIPNVIQSGF
nr:sialin-like [Cherax quadricarinatus]